MQKRTPAQNDSGLGAEFAAERGGHTLVRTEIRTADSSLHGRPVRESADWKEKAPAVPLGMTTLEAPNEGDLGMTTLKAKTIERFFAPPPQHVQERHAPGTPAPPPQHAQERHPLGTPASLRMTAVLPSAAGRSLRGASRGAAAGLLLFGIRFYQAVLARLMPVGCKFYPTCSHYAAEAIERHGAARGARLALARLWRCRPFTQGGFDPVPDGQEISNGAAEAASHSANEAEGGARAEAGS
jgi:uncharacterized protein